MARFDAVGFDLLTALLDTWSLWRSVAGDDDLGMRWHAASQSRLRGRRYHSFEDNVRAAAADIGLVAERTDELLRRWDESAPWPDVPAALAALPIARRFVVTNCSERLGTLAAGRAGRFELVMTAERAGFYKPDARAYRAALAALGLDGRRVLFVAGSAHDVHGASRLGMAVYWANRGRVPPPPDGTALREEPDLRALAEVAS